MVKKPYTKKEYNEFNRLVLLAESHRQKQPEFIERVGREKCDLMFEELKRESE